MRLPTLDFVDKLNLLRQALNQLNLPFRDKRHVEYVLAGLLLRGEANVGQHYRKTLMAAKDDTIKTAPPNTGWGLLPDIRDLY